MSISESLAPEDIKPTRLLRSDKHQRNTDESDSECLSPIPTIVLQDRTKTSANELAMNRLSITESDSESVTIDANNRLVPPEEKPKQRAASATRQIASDMEEESSSEYEATNDHTRLCLVCFRDKSISNDSMGTELDSRRPIDKTRRYRLYL